MPTSPTERRQGTVDPPVVELHPCPFCGERHQPVRMGGGGLMAYAAQVVPEPGQSRPRPLGREAGHTAALLRDNWSPWRAHPAAEPPPPGPTTLRERVAVWWRGDESTT